MLASLQDDGAARAGAKAKRSQKRAGASQPRWLWPIGLALLVTTAVVVAMYFNDTTGSGDANPDAATSPLVAAGTPTPLLHDANAPNTVPAAQPAPLGVADPASAPALVTAPVASASAGDQAMPAGASASVAATGSEPTGPAKLELRNEGLAGLPGMATTVQAVAAQRAAASGAVEPASAVAAVPGAASGTAAAAAVAKAPTQSERAQPSTAKAANGKPAHNSKPAASSATASAKAKQATAARSAATARAVPHDPDAELVAAIMARSSGEQVATASERSSTIAALVRDCNALPDAGSALACRRRICAGYWGKAQACPRSMAPPANATTGTTSNGAASH